MIGVGVFDFGGFAFFGAFYRSQLPCLVIAIRRRRTSRRFRFSALTLFVVGVRLACAFFELIAFVVRVCARSLRGGVIGGVVFIFGGAVFCETVVFVVRVFHGFRAGQAFGGRLFDLAITVARVNER